MQNKTTRGEEAPSPEREAIDPGFDAPQSEAAAKRRRADQRDRTARLDAYTQAAQVLLAARGFPVLGAGDTPLTASNQENLDRAIKRECKRALLAILDDMRRIAASAHESDEHHSA
jgi:hypothetical protein